MLGWDKNFDFFLEHLKDALQKPLPGFSAHFSMLPPARQAPDFDQIEAEFKPKKAAVMALFYPEKNRPNLVFIKRNRYPGVHSAQISFPGGKKEPGDENDLHTALRETQEEIGVNAEKIIILGELSRVYIPPSNFLVQPVVGYVGHSPEFFPDNKEVDELLPLPFGDFFIDEAIHQTRVETHGLEMHVPAYHVQNRIIWGATAMMVAELRSLFHTS